MLHLHMCLCFCMFLFHLASFLVKCFQTVVQTVVVQWPFFKRQADLLISPDLMANVEINRIAMVIGETGVTCR